MYKIQILIDKTNVRFINLIENTDIYNIPKQDLNDMIEHNCSAWILQLMDKTWINKDLLYEFAAIINQECPRNSIDWYKTFYPVEMKYYKETEFDNLSTKNDSMIERIIDKIKFSRELALKPETQTKINEILNEKFKIYNLK